MVAPSRHLTFTGKPRRRWRVPSARKKRRTKAIHAKIANRRHNFLHTRTSAIIAAFDYIVVGNVNAQGLAKTSMAKSVYDAGWSSFRTQLAYKVVKHGAWFQEVDERFTTQVCSHCGALPDRQTRLQGDGDAPGGLAAGRQRDVQQ